MFFTICKKHLLCFSSLPVSLLIPALRGLSKKKKNKTPVPIYASPGWTSSVGLAGADGEFPVTRAATELMHACEETIHYVFPLLCGFFLVSVHPRGPRLAASRWVKASYRWSGFDLGLGGEECGSG